MTDYGITGYGAYVPRLRLNRTAIASIHKGMVPSLRGLAKGERAYTSWDEDAITMAVEAARDALGQGSRENITRFSLASTTLPYADLQNSAIAIGALGLEKNTRGTDHAGTHKAGLAALSEALRYGEQNQLVVGSDRLRAKPASPQEMIYGAGAAALCLGSDKIIARLKGAASITEQFIDHFRSSQQDHDYFWEERWIRDEGYGKILPKVAAEALAEAGCTIDDITTVIIPSSTRGAAAVVGRKLGFKGTLADDLSEGVGFTGAAHSLLMLASVLETAKAGDKIMVMAFGQGAEAIILEVTEEITSFRPARGLSAVIGDKISSDDYIRMISFYGEISLEGGMRAEKSGKAALTTLYRHADQLSSFVAGKCDNCGTIQFPQLAYCVNTECQKPASQFSEYPLTEESAKVLTFTADWLSYHPAPPLYVGFVQFDNGARLLMEMVDSAPGELDVGTELKMVFRIKEPDKIRGFNRYFWKATPIAKGV